MSYPCRKRPLRGLGLLEMLVVMVLLVVISYVSFMSLNNAARIWRRVMGTEDASLQMAKVQHNLESELKRGNFDKVKVRNVPGTGPNALPSGTSDGGAVWFLSAVNPATGQQVVDSEGDLFWQRNVIYYLAVPGKHKATFGIACHGGLGPNGQDDRCPHKVLIRKVVDAGAATTPTAKQEALLTTDQVKNYLKRPVGFDVSAMKTTEDKTQDVKIIANNLLTFNVKLGPDPQWPEEIVVDIQAVGLKEAGKALQVGTEALAANQYTRSRRFSVFPMNNDI